MAPTTFRDAIVTESFLFAADGETPNHPDFPLLVHRNGAEEARRGGAAAIEALFGANGWRGFWRDGVYPFHHFHSSCCEALAIASGWAEVRFGGEGGQTLRLETGDVAVLPAGTGHKRMAASGDLLVVGAYPPDQPYDMIRSGELSGAELKAAIERIAAAPIPATDPVFGSEDGLRARWRWGEDAP